MDVEPNTMWPSRLCREERKPIQQLCLRLKAARFESQISVSLVPLPNVDIPDPATLWRLRLIVTWTAAHVFRVTTPLIYSDSGSGDKTFHWVLLFCIFVFAVAPTALWSILDRKRSNYITLYKWFRVATRFCLAGQMFAYGWAKLSLSRCPTLPPGA